MSKCFFFFNYYTVKNSAPTIPHFLMTINWGIFSTLGYYGVLAVIDPSSISI